MDANQDFLPAARRAISLLDPHAYDATEAALLSSGIAARASTAGEKIAADIIARLVKFVQWSIEQGLSPATLPLDPQIDLLKTMAVNALTRIDEVVASQCDGAGCGGTKGPCAALIYWRDEAERARLCIADRFLKELSRDMPPFPVQVDAGNERTTNEPLTNLSR